MNLNFRKDDVLTPICIQICFREEGATTKIKAVKILHIFESVFLDQFKYQLLF